MLGGLGLGLSSCSTDPSQTKTDMNSWSEVTGSMRARRPSDSKVRVAMLGLETALLIEMLEWLVTQGHAEITALCDVQPAYVQRAEKVASFQRPPRASTILREGWRQACNPELGNGGHYTPGTSHTRGFVL